MARKPKHRFNISRAEAEAYLGYGRGTLAVLHHRGTVDIPYCYLGNGAWYSKEDLDAYVESRVVRAHEGA